MPLLLAGESGQDTCLGRPDERDGFRVRCFSSFERIATFSLEYGRRTAFGSVFAAPSPRPCCGAESRGLASTRPRRAPAATCTALRSSGGLTRSTCPMLIFGRIVEAFHCATRGNRRRCPGRCCKGGRRASPCRSPVAPAARPKPPAAPSGAIDHRRPAARGARGDASATTTIMPVLPPASCLARLHRNEAHRIEPDSM